MIQIYFRKKYLPSFIPNRPDLFDGKDWHYRVNVCIFEKQFENVVPKGTFDFTDGYSQPTPGTHCGILAAIECHFAYSIIRKFILSKNDTNILQNLPKQVPEKFKFLFPSSSHLTNGPSDFLKMIMFYDLFCVKYFDFHLDLDFQIRVLEQF